ncbi:MAG: HNH nuclease family protein [Lentisphaerae bacterium]|nr:HNH nuclease family protein [Lentisphaerota bacterium]
MKPRKTPPTPERQAELRAMLRQNATERAQGYRDRALKVLPHVCASCGREFEGKTLRELTVHHKDHNWKNNPPDGSNWELLCLYCHDHEHEKYKMAGYGSGGGGPESAGLAPSIFSPFADLDKLVSVEPEADAGDDDAQSPPGDDDAKDPGK